MKYLYTSLLLTAFWLMGQGGLSAQPVLGLSANSISDSTPVINTTISILTMLTNLSAVDTFTGIINFTMADLDSIITNVNVVGMPNFAGTSITLAPLQQRAALFTVTLLPTYFRAGPEIIIVWPVATGIHIADSARAAFNIAWPSGIAGAGADSITAYEYDEQLIIRNAGGETYLREVRIFDAAGRECANYMPHSLYMSIPLHSLPEGIYVADILCENGYTKRVRLVR